MRHRDLFGVRALAPLKRNPPSGILEALLRRTKIINLELLLNSNTKKKLKNMRIALTRPSEKVTPLKKLGAKLTRQIVDQEIRRRLDRIHFIEGSRLSDRLDRSVGVPGNINNLPTIGAPIKRISVSLPHMKPVKRIA
jgi:hypothetical protein